MHKVILKSLHLGHFRCFEYYETCFDTGLVLLVGENGTGKTSILEAMSLFSNGRGIRSANLDALARRLDFSRRVEASWWIRGAFNSDLEGDFQLAVGAEIKEGEKERRFFKRDGEPIRPSDVAQLVQFVWCAPQLERQFCENASFRRKFLDRLIEHYDYAHKRRLVRYEQLMRERSILFKKRQFDACWLDIIEQEIAQLAAAILTTRYEFIEKITFFCADPILLFSPITLAFEGRFEALAGLSPALKLEEQMKEVLLEERHKICQEHIFERGSLFPLGPHRSEFILREEKTGKDFLLASTGQRKLMLLRLILSHVAMLKEECHSIPILLLDDIAAYLDEKKQAMLFEALEQLNCQSFCSMTLPSEAILKQSSQIIKL